MTRESRWDELVAVAAEVFGEKGYRATTLSEIADRLGILKGSLYHYIETKEDLLFEVLKRWALKGIEVATESDESRAADAPTRLAAFIDTWMSQPPSAARRGHLSEADVKYLTGTRLAEVDALHRQLGRIPLGIIKDGMSEGSFDPGVNPLLATDSLFQLLLGTDRRYAGRQPAKRSEISSWYVQLMLGGLTLSRRSGPAANGL
jgi:AcrR family transcriptional regulator